MRAKDMSRTQRSDFGRRFRNGESPKTLGADYGIDPRRVAEFARTLGLKRVRVSKALLERRAMTEAGR